MTRITGISTWMCERLEESLLPVKGDLIKKVACYAYQFFKFCLFFPLSIATSLLSFAATRLFPKKPIDPPLVDFAKHPEWDKQPVNAAPVDIGFATADFQDNGPAQHPNSNWGAYYQKKEQPLGQMPDVWNHPERVLDRLDELGVKKFRFSISRDQIEPELGRPLNQVALQHYRNFCRELRLRGIEPMATLHHFSDPLYFSWEKSEDIDGFVRYAEAVSEVLYEEGVRKIITINEPTVVAFQGKVMGEFPPHGKLDFEGAACMLENMMRAHTRVYEKLKARHPDFEIGLTHDPIRFRHFHKTHPLFSPAEKLVCHYLTEINHSALMRFLQTGKFSLKVPFRTNYAFEFPTKPPLDFIGLQYYTDPLLKFSLTNGESVTRNPGEKITSYQYRVYPQGMASILEEFKTLGVPIDLTEIGIDIGINKDGGDQERIAYFDKVFQVVQKAIDHGTPIRSLYFWTLIDNLEWYKAWAVRFGFYSFDPATGQIAPRPVSQWLQGRITARNALAGVGE
ncbi:MAG: family 1 glycosylhydrolase [Chlamydiota bacterium]